MTALALILPLAGVALAALAPFERTFGLVLLSARMELDASAGLVLAVVALLWVAAAFRQAADGWPDGRYRLAFPLVQAGSLGALVAGDAVTYYTCFSLMTLASYALVDVGPRARWAAALYLGAALVGEMILLAGLMMVADASPHPLAPWLILFGLGAKLGLVPFHVALAPAYAAAPPAGAAILGGVLTTVAAVGWLRFLPATGAPELAPPIVAVGFVTAFAGAGVGLFQRDGKALLAYSTVSQMGLLAVGAGLAMAGGWQAAAPMLLVFLLHHALAKSALLLGVDDAGGAPNRVVWAALLLVSLSLAGFPGTGGTVAKGGLEGLAGHDAPLAALWSASSLATAALMGRFLLLARPGGVGRSWGVAWPGLLAAGGALVLPWMIADPATAAAAWSPAKMAAHVWPAVLGAAIAALQWRLLPGWWLPAGDLAALLRPVIAAWRPPPRGAAPRPRRRLPALRSPALDVGERILRSTPAFVLLLAGLSCGLFVLIATARG